ncbi:STY0301 family protein [Xanthomonas sacchari]|uniref:STY0301 family protein n=2 Tax=Xanthomonas TaxID=338 RepID=UPI0022528359|nr:STY0301 family protein [Xanthomonas sacchari]
MTKPRACYELGVHAAIVGDEATTPTDVSDEEWAFAAPDLILMDPQARQRRYELQTMETTSMPLSKQIAALLLCLFAWSTVLAAPSVCPIRQDQPLRSIDAFDGEPQDLATLEPDVAKERYGHWVLGYIYDEGRFVTVRCRYADKQTHDVKLANRVEQCSYSINAKHVLRVTCR